MNIRNIFRFNDLLVLFPDARHNAGEHNASVSNGRVQFLNVVAVLTFCQILQELFHLIIRQMDAVAVEFPLQLGPALDDVLLPPFFLEPLADLVAGLAGLDNF